MDNTKRDVFWHSVNWHTFERGHFLWRTRGYVPSRTASDWRSPCSDQSLRVRWISGTPAPSWTWKYWQPEAIGDLNNAAATRRAERRLGLRKRFRIHKNPHRHQNVITFCEPRPTLQNDQNPFITFWVIWETDRRTDKPVVDVARDAQCCVHTRRSHTRTSSSKPAVSRHSIIAKRELGEI